MYETLMDLPLFKGVGKDHISAFLEKTSVEFTVHHPGETILEPGTTVEDLKFIISGNVNIMHSLPGEDIMVTEHSGPARVLGADRLFGIFREADARVVAQTKCSVMTFGKAQYLALVNTDRIYMLNLLNYLSVRAQRPAHYITRMTAGSPASRLGVLVALLTDPATERVTLRANDIALANYCGVPESEIALLRQTLQAEGLAQCDRHTIAISSRQRFVDWTEQE